MLRGRYEVEVLVGGDRERIEQVLELNPDYIGPAGSKSREAWNAQLEGALSGLASDEDEMSDEELRVAREEGYYT